MNPIDEKQNEVFTDPVVNIYRGMLGDPFSSVEPNSIESEIVE